MRFLPALLLVACVELPIGPEPAIDHDTAATAPDTEVCEAVEQPLAIDAVSPAGFSGADVEGIVATSRSAEIVWEDGTVSTVHVDVVRAGDPVWLDVQPLDTGAACQGDHLALDFTVRVHTEDGQLDVTYPWAFRADALPDDVFADTYVETPELVGSLPVPDDARSLSVVVHERADGSTNGILQWIVGGGDETLVSEVDVGAWGSYRTP